MAANRQTKPLADLAVNPPIGLICYRPHVRISVYYHYYSTRKLILILRMILS